MYAVSLIHLVEEQDFADANSIEGECQAESRASPTDGDVVGGKSAGLGSRTKTKLSRTATRLSQTGIQLP